MRIADSRETLQASIGILAHRPPNRHHQCNRGIDLLVCPLSRRIQVSASVGLADDGSETPFRHRIAVMASRPARIASPISIRAGMVLYFLTR
jgi:hypothetical protein